MTSQPPTTLEEALAENAVLRAQVVRLEALVARLEARVAELEARLNQNSQNSSKPPSSDPPSLKFPPKKPPSGRKPGGQPGHKGSQRRLLPSEQVDSTADHWPTECENCQRHLPKGVRVEVGEALRHQVVEVPEVKGHVTEHRLHSQCCDGCGHATQAQLPDGVAQGAFGPRLQAALALFTGCYHVSKRTVQSALGDLFGVDLSLGSVSATEQNVSAALEVPVTEAHQHVQQSTGAVHADETGWREARKRAWLWIAGTALVTVFQIHASRGADAARALLGKLATGILVTDRWSAYRGWSIKMRQVCWAHLIRDFNFIAESKGVAGVVGAALLLAAEDVFELWYRARDGTLSRSTLKREMKPLRERIEHLLKRGAGCHAPGVSGMCLEILTVQEAMWTFVRVEGVEPTNNFGERNLRPAVLWRKGSFGTHSEAGSRFAERMLTVVATLRLQHRNVFDYLVKASEAHLHRQAAPSLLPIAT